jgi:hypothetical protein
MCLIKYLTLQSNYALQILLNKVGRKIEDFHDWCKG